MDGYSSISFTPTRGLFQFERIFLVVLLFIIISSSLNGQQLSETLQENTITLQLKNVHVVEVLKTLAEKGNLNIAVGLGVQGLVTVFLEDVSVSAALDIVVETSGLAYIKENGVTIVLSGLIEKKESKTVKKVPLLGSIPLLGYLFISTDTMLEDSELVLFITPYIINGDVPSDKVWDSNA